MVSLSVSWMLSALVGGLVVAVGLIGYSILESVNRVIQVPGSLGFWAVTTVCLFVGSSLLVLALAIDDVELAWMGMVCLGASALMGGALGGAVLHVRRSLVPTEKGSVRGPGV